MGGLIMVIHHEIAATHYACMTAKGVMDVYTGQSSQITVIYLRSRDVQRPNEEKVGEVADAPVDSAYITEDHFSYPSAAHDNDSDISVSYVHYKTTPDCLEQMAKHEAFKEEVD